MTNQRSFTLGWLAAAQSATWGLGLASAIAGLLVGAQERAVEDNATDYPFVALGVGIGLAGIFWAVIVLAVLHYMTWRVETT